MALLLKIIIRILSELLLGAMRSSYKSSKSPMTEDMFKNVKKPLKDVVEKL